jgi:predicted N-acetyltransferase YhbS
MTPGAVAGSTNAARTTSAITVAEDSSGVIAHVMLSWVGVEDARTRILNLTPMSVRPDRQRIGVGARLPGFSSDLAGRIVYPAAFDPLGY